MRIGRRKFLLGLAGAAMLTGWYSLDEARRVDVSRLEWGLGCRLVFLADMHIHDYGSVEEEIASRVTELSPDVIALGGDIVDGLTPSMEPVRRYLSLIEAREKIAVMGNHDYWSGRAAELAGLLKGFGYHILMDSSVDTCAGRIVGLDWRDDRKYPEAWGLIIVHDPNAAVSSAPGSKIIAGHTHGGVVVAGVPILTNSLFTRGLYRLSGDRILYVSRGLGQIIPLRPTSPLEIVVVD